VSGAAPPRLQPLLICKEKNVLAYGEEHGDGALGVTSGGPRGIPRGESPLLGSGIARSEARPAAGHPALPRPNGNGLCAWADPDSHLSDPGA